MREVHWGVGVHVGRGAVVVRGGAVVVGRGVVLVDVGLFVEVLDVDVLLEDELVDEDELDEDELVDEGVSVEVSWTGRSSTGCGSAGEAATRKPRNTSRGTQSITARRNPSRPMRRRFMTGPRCCVQN